MGVTMATPTPTGYLFVRPDYSHEGKPDFVLVTVGYRSPFAELFSDANLEDVINHATRQMEPEYKVTGGFERPEGGLAIFLTITEQSR